MIGKRTGRPAGPVTILVTLVLHCALLLACSSPALRRHAPSQGPVASDAGPAPLPQATTGTDAASATRPVAFHPPAGQGPFWFVDVAGLAGIDVAHVGGNPEVVYIIETIGSGAGWLDFDGDGRLDLYLAQGSTLEHPDEAPPDRLFRNRGDGTFEDVTERAELGDRAWSFGVTVADYDNDGDPDIYLTNWGPNRLYRNNGDGTFTDVAEAAGVADPRWGTSAAWGDVDGDGDLDLYVANYVEFDTERVPARGTPLARGPYQCIWKNMDVCCGPRGLEPAPDVFYLNRGDPDGDGIPRFEEATAAAGLTVGPYYALGVVFFDANGDGHPDIYVANDSVQNTFFINRGDGTFEEQALYTGLAFNELGDEQAGMGVASGDVDGDGIFDLAVTNFSHDHDTIYRNTGKGFFDDISYAAGIGTASWFTLGWGVGLADLDLDGWEDLFVAHGHVYPQVDEKDIGSTYRQRCGLFRHTAAGTYEEITERAGPGLEILRSSRGAAFGDYDGDGDLDILVTNMNEPPYLLRNDSAPANWLAVRLVGIRTNRDGIGSRVSILAGGRTQVKEVRANYSYLSSSEPVARFGLGRAESVERVEVRWPSGAVSLVEKVKPNQILVVTEPLTP